MKILLERYDAIVEVDDADLAEFSRYRWYVGKRGNTRYVSRNENGACIFLHRQLMAPQPGMVVDHIDGNGLNNRRDNLRTLTHTQNLWNRRGDSHGICFSAAREQWRATISHEGKRLELGFFVDRADAQKARDIASLILRGSIGSLNDPSLTSADFAWLVFTPKARAVLMERLAA